MKYILSYLSVFIVFVWSCSAVALDAENFDAWLNGVRVEALDKGISAKIVKVALHDGLKPLPRILELDRKQPEKTISFKQYKRNIVSKTRIYQGRLMMRVHRKELRQASRAYGVPERIIVALWGMETNYGGYTGGFSIVEALATLAYDGRRSEYFRGELLQALKILDEGHIAPEEMKGSWAGAMGQSQFMPSSFLRYAVDFNHDGKRDIWHTKADVFASAANYLVQNGWREGERWGRLVQIPAKGLPDNFFGLDVKKTLIEWQKLGVRKQDGGRLPIGTDMVGSLVKFTNGADIETYLVYNNYRAIMRWNKSTYFATAIGLLSDQLRY